MCRAEGSTVAMILQQFTIFNILRNSVCRIDSDIGNCNRRRILCEEATGRHGSDILFIITARNASTSPFYFIPFFFIHIDPKRYSTLLAVLKLP